MAHVLHRPATEPPAVRDGGRPGGLDDLLQRSDIWRGGTHAASAHVLPTGHAALDAAIGGWPRGALTELLADSQGIGEISLLLPALAALSQQQRWIAFVAPPHIPYAPALAAAGIDLARFLWLRPDSSADALWAMEQSLRSGVCGAVLGWPVRADHRALRRLQLAAETGDALAVVYRPRRAAADASPAALRLELEPAAGGLRIHALKRRGGWNMAPLFIARDRGQ